MDQAGCDSFSKTVAHTHTHTRALSTSSRVKPTFQSVLQKEVLMSPGSSCDPKHHAAGGQDGSWALSGQRKTAEGGPEISDT